MPVLECSRCNELSYSAARPLQHQCDRCGSDRHRCFEVGNRLDRVKAMVREVGQGDHCAAVYEEPEGVADWCARYLSEGVARGERALVVLAEPLVGMLRDRIDVDRRAGVDFAEPAEAYADFSVGGMVDRWRAIIAGEKTPIRMVDGLDAGSAASIDSDQWRLLELRAHAELFDGHVSAICLYDSNVLGPEFLSIATANHPLVARDGKLWRNEDFVYEPAPA